MDYIREPDAIYRASFETIRREARLERVPAELRAMALRLIHACGMPDLVDDLACTEGAVEGGRRALAGGAPVLVDTRMVAAGVQTARLPAGSDVVCMIDHPAVAALAAQRGTTRSAAGVELARERLGGAIVAIGNAPTALFRLLELLGEGAPRPALVLAFPVGFIGAAEAKEALVQGGALAHVTLRGRRGGSALAAAAINALMTDAP